MAGRCSECDGTWYQGDLGESCDGQCLSRRHSRHPLVPGTLGILLDEGNRFQGVRHFYKIGGRSVRFFGPLDLHNLDTVRERLAFAGYAQFLYDPSSDRFKPYGTDASFGKKVCYQWHTAVAARDYIFTNYPKVNRSVKQRIQKAMHVYESYSRTEHRSVQEASS
jgi:hypothetical protein